MFAVTAADEKFKPILDLWEERVIACGMTPVIYDLGGLGRGQSFIPMVKGYNLFRLQGYYSTLASGQYKSRAVHKPLICEHAAKELAAPFLYLDMDAILRGEPTKMYGDWAVGVTVRPPSEWDRTTDEKRSYLGKINAGVLWFNNMPDSRDFIAAWKKMTLEEENDQRALNLLLAQIERDQLLKEFGAMPFPTEIYNNYYTDGIDRAVIVHLKNNEWQGKTTDELRERCKLIPPVERDENDVYFSLIDDSMFDIFDLVNSFDCDNEMMRSFEPGSAVANDDPIEDGQDIPEATSFTPASIQGS